MMLRAAISMMAFLVALVLATDPAPLAYTVSEIEWTFDAFGNGTMVNLTGHVEKVLHELSQISPTFYHEIMNTPVPPVNQAELRKDFGPRCGTGPNLTLAAPAEDIDGGIYMLRRMPGQPSLGPGPRNCGKVFCGTDNRGDDSPSSIWWCNDKPEIAYLPSFNTIADCAQVLNWDCSWYDIGAFEVLVIGENFNPGDWTCFVRSEDINNISEC